MKNLRGVVLLILVVASVAATNQPRQMTSCKEGTCTAKQTGATSMLQGTSQLKQRFAEVKGMEERNAQGHDGHRAETWEEKKQNLIDEAEGKKETSIEGYDEKRTEKFAESQGDQQEQSSQKGYRDQGSNLPTNLVLVEETQSRENQSKENQSNIKDKEQQLLSAGNSTYPRPVQYASTAAATSDGGDAPKLLETRRYKDSHDHSDTHTGSELDESVHRKGSPRRRSNHMHADTTYHITRDYSVDHFDRCRHHLYREHGYGTTLGILYAEIVLFEDGDCKGKDHRFDIEGSKVPWKTPLFDIDIIKTQHLTHANDKITSFGIVINLDLQFDGKCCGTDQDGTPWFQGGPAKPRRRSISGRGDTPWMPHDDNEWCFEFYEHANLNGQDVDCVAAKERNAGVTCNAYKDPGLKYTQCCTAEMTTDRRTGFCAWNVPANFNDKISSWSFYRSHRRRNGIKPSCMTDLVENTEVSLGQCMENAAVSAAWGLVGGLIPLPISIADIRGAHGALDSCALSCSGSFAMPNCAENLAWLSAGKAIPDLLQSGFAKKFGTSLFGGLATHLATTAVGTALDFANCFLSEFREFFSSCLAPSTVFRGTGQNNGLPLHSLEVESAITVVNVGSISNVEEVVGESKVVDGTVLGFAKKKDKYARQYTELKTTSGKSVRCTPKHYLWVKKADGTAKLLLAENVRKGYSLPVVGAPSSSVKWEIIEDVTEDIIEKGAVMPIARTSDWETADMVVTEAGIVVPIYAGGGEYTALTPSDAHNLFKAWLHHWSKLHAELPCLMKISHSTHGSMLVKLLQGYGQNHHAGKLGKVEMNPPEFLCYVYEHMDEFRDTIIDADRKDAQECEGITELIKACDDNMQSTIEKDVLTDNGGVNLVPDPILPSEGKSTVDAGM